MYKIDSTIRDGTSWLIAFILLYITHKHFVPSLNKKHQSLLFKLRKRRGKGSIYLKRKFKEIS